MTVIKKNDRKVNFSDVRPRKNIMHISTELSVAQMYDDCKQKHRDQKCGIKKNR